MNENLLSNKRFECLTQLISWEISSKNTIFTFFLPDRGSSSDFFMTIVDLVFGIHRKRKRNTEWHINMRDRIKLQPLSKIEFVTVIT